MGRRPKAVIEAAAYPVSMNESQSPLKLENKPAVVENQRKTNKLNVIMKISKGQSAAVRRSGRLRNITLQNQSIVEQINLANSDNEDEQQYDEKEPIEFQDNTPELEPEPEPEPEPILAGSILEEKFNILVESVQQLKQVITDIAQITGNRTSTDLVYKDLYLDSQKKVKALTIESDQLREKLEAALLRLETIDVSKGKMKQQMMADMKFKEAGTKRHTRANK